MALSFAPVSIHVLGIKINALDHTSALSMGPSQHLDVFVSYKRNQGIGEQNGDFSTIFAPVSWVADADVSDSPTMKNSLL